MAEEATGNQLTFNVKSANDQKHVVSITDNVTVRDLKEKLSTAEYADIPADRQRLIYSGRVMKDGDALSTYKIKDGNTIHMVKGAASNQQRNPETAASASNSVPPNAGVPQNIAAGTGNDPLAGLTGARYAGFAQMPSMDTFGSDGGMNMGNPEEMLRMLENPMFQSQMNEAMNNPQVIQMMENNPMFRDQPHLREMFRNPEMRRMMMDPAFIRQSMRLSQAMQGGGMGGGSDGNMPAPGVTDTTPSQGQGATQGSAATGNAGSAPQNPFGMFGQTGAGGAQANPFASLFGAPPAAGAGGTGGAEGTTGTDSTRSAEQNQQQNPFGSMFGQPGAGQGDNSIQQMAQRMMQNPEMMRMAMGMMGGGGGAGGAGDAGGAGTQGGAPFNPFAMLGGGGGGFGAPPAAPQDSRPPEEQYADQLRQLNDMGFFDFDRNVRALRMAGGRVEGAVEMLLGGTI